MVAERTTSTSSTDLLPVRVGKADDVSTVHLVGEFDISTTGLLFYELERLDGDVVIDLAWLSFLDSSGIETLNAHRRRLERMGGSFTLCRANPHIRHVLSIVGPDDWLDG
jgi:anti-anti-sigma factor